MVLGRFALFQPWPIPMSGRTNTWNDIPQESHYLHSSPVCGLRTLRAEQAGAPILESNYLSTWLISSLNQEIMAKKNGVLGTLHNSFSMVPEFNTF